MASSLGDHAPASSGDANVHREPSHSAESNTAWRSPSSTEGRQQLFRDTIARLS